MRLLYFSAHIDKIYPNHTYNVNARAPAFSRSPVYVHPNRRARSVRDQHIIYPPAFWLQSCIRKYKRSVLSDPPLNYNKLKGINLGNHHLGECDEKILKKRITFWRDCTPLWIYPIFMVNRCRWSFAVFHYKKKNRTWMWNELNWCTWNYACGKLSGYRLHSRS